MKCMLCGTVDEAVEIETGFTDPAKRAAAEAKASEQAERLSHWKHLQVTATMDGARVELLAGDICPAENLTSGSIAVTRA
jgi:hypothetical protein